MFNPVLLERVFDLRRDGIVILKVLPEGPAQCAHALLLLLYGYQQVKKEYVLERRGLAAVSLRSDRLDQS
jgi:hypothetical protein